MKKIVVPVDFSLHAEYALEVAATLARKSNAQLLVLHMMGLSEAVFTKDASQEAAEAHYYMKLSKKRFTEFLDKPYLKGIQITEMVQNYKIFSEINQVAIEHKAELIVMGSHGTSGASQLFVGSNTEKVVRTSDIPVLVVKERRPDFNPDLIVFALDYKVENIKAYQSAMNLFSKWGSKVHLLYVNLPNEKFKSSEEIQHEADLFFKVAHHGDIPPNAKLINVSDYSVEGGIFTYAEAINADLIALPTHGRKGLAHFFRGSIGEDVANHAPLPVLTLKA